MGTTALTAMQMMDSSQGANTMHPGQAHAFGLGSQALPFSTGDLRSRGELPPSTVNMITDMQAQVQGSSLHSLAKAPPSKNQINIVAKKRPPSMPLKNHEEHGIDPKRKVLYRNFHDVDGVIYLVEISRNALKVFILLFPNFEAPDIFLCESMAEKKAQKLMAESNNMFEELVTKFHVKYGKLQIQGYHGLAPDPRKLASPGTYSRFSQQPSLKRAAANTHPARSQLAEKYGYGAEESDQLGAPVDGRMIGALQAGPDDMLQADQNSLPEINIKATNNVGLDDGPGPLGVMRPEDLIHAGALEHGQLNYRSDANADDGVDDQVMLRSNVQNGTGGVQTGADQLVDPMALHARAATGDNLAGATQSYDFALPQDDNQHDRAST